MVAAAAAVKAVICRLDCGVRFTGRRAWDGKSDGGNDEEEEEEGREGGEEEEE